MADRVKEACEACKPSRQSAATNAAVICDVPGCMGREEPTTAGRSLIGRVMSIDCKEAIAVLRPNRSRMTRRDFAKFCVTGANKLATCCCKYHRFVPLTARDRRLAAPLHSPKYTVARIMECLRIARLDRATDRVLFLFHDERGKRGQGSDLGTDTGRSNC